MFQLYGSYEYKSTGKVVDAVITFDGKSKKFLGIYALNNKKGAKHGDNRHQAAPIEFSDGDIFTPLISYVFYRDMRYRKFDKVQIQKRYARPIRIFKGMEKMIKLREQTIHQVGKYPIAFKVQDYAGNQAIDSVIIDAKK